MEALPSVARHAGNQGVYTFSTLATGAASVPGASTPILQGTRSQVGILPTMDGIAVMAFPQGAGPVQPSMEGVGSLVAGDPPLAILAGGLCAVQSYPAATFPEPSTASAIVGASICSHSSSCLWLPLWGFQRPDTRYISWCSPPPECPAALGRPLLEFAPLGVSGRSCRFSFHDHHVALANVILRQRLEIAGTNELRLLCLHSDFQSLQAGA